MKINWKDFGLMFVIGVAIFAAATIFSPYLGSVGAALYWFLFLLIPYGVPIVFYFYRNKSELKEAAVVSFIFGFISTMIFTFTSLLLIMYPIIPNQYGPAGTILWPDPLTLLMSVSVLSIIYAIFSLICGLVIWSVIKELKWKKS